VLERSQAAEPAVAPTSAKVTLADFKVVDSHQPTPLLLDQIDTSESPRQDLL
jgi:hypothetical protein